MVNLFRQIYPTIFVGISIWNIFLCFFYTKTDLNQNPQKKDYKNLKILNNALSNQLFKYSKLRVICLKILILVDCNQLKFSTLIYAQF
jgi:hypothetical protein